MVYDSFTETQWDSICPSLSIADIRSYIYQILSGIEFCHRKRIVHRNISWSSLHLDANKKRIQIGGWKYAVFRDDIHPMEQDVKMPYFKSPERLLDEFSSCSVLKFDFPVDMWSVGCVLGCFIFRKMYMFNGVDALMTMLNIVEIMGSKAVLDFIKKYDINYDLPSYGGYENMAAMNIKRFITEGNKEVATDEAINLLKNLIVVDPADRFSAERTLQHYFFMGCDASDNYLQRWRKPTSIFNVNIGICIGSGSFSSVYKICEAIKTGSQKVVRELAAKYIRYEKDKSSERERLAKREIKALKLLRGCPNIIKIHGVLNGGPVSQFNYRFRLILFIHITFLVKIFSWIILALLWSI